MEKLDSKTIDTLVELQQTLNNPIFHTPIDLGINEFKRMIRSFYKDKHTRNKLIKAFKKRSWMEYKSIARFRGNFPSHPNYGSEIRIEEEVTEFEVKVNAKR